MHKEISYGIIPLRECSGKWEILLVKHGKGHWAFPKGHPELHELPKHTAIRELKEETGLDIANFLDIPKLEEHYFFHQGADLIDKKVIYFAATVTGTISLQDAEISDYKWLALEEAKDFVTFKASKELCKTIYAMLVERRKVSRIAGNSSS